MQAKETLWSVPSTPVADNASAFDCFGPFCVLGVASTLYVVERQSMKVANCLSGGHPPQATITFVSCTQSKLGGDNSQARKVVVASGDTHGTLVTWILHEGQMLNVLNPHNRAGHRQETSPRDSQGGSSVRSICWSGTDSRLLVALYEKSEVVIWDYLKGQPVWQSCLNPKQELTHMVRCHLDYTCLCVTNDQGLVYVMFVNESEEEKVQLVEYQISASDSKFMRCQFGMMENLLHIVLEHTLIAFDIDYGIPIGSAVLPRKYSAFQDILAVNFQGQHILCSHRDGSVSAWECNESKSVYTLLHLVPTVSFDGFYPRNKMVQVFADKKIHDSEFGDKIQLLVTTANEEAGGYLHLFSARDFGSLEEIRLESMLRLLPQQCTAFALQPPGENGDSNQVALGSNIGTLEVVDLLSGQIARSFRVHGSALLGVKWLRGNLVLSFAVENVSENAFKNHLVVLDTASGKKRVVRGGAGNDPSALRGVRTSKSGNHFLLIFKNGITEIWRLERPSLACSRIRVMNLPFTCIEFVQDIPPFFLSRERATTLDGSTAGLNTSLGGLMSSAENRNARSRSGSQAETNSNQGKEILLFALPDRSLGAVEVSGQTKKLRDIKPNFPVIDASPGEFVSALACNEQNLIVGTSSGEVKVWSQSKDQFGVYKLANWEGSVRKIISDPCLISSDFLVLSAKNMFHRINVDHMPLKIVRVEGNTPGTEVLDIIWSKNCLGRQYVTCTRDGVFIYSDQAGLASKITIKNILLDPKMPDRLAMYMQKSLPLTKSGGGALLDQQYSSEFRSMAEGLELTDVEMQQAHESYRKCLAELTGGQNGISALIDHYSSSLASASLGSLDCMKLLSSNFGRTSEEFDFWAKLADTLNNVMEGNYGGVGCLWDAAKQKAKAAKSIYWHESYTGPLNATKRERRVLEYFVLGDRESAIAFLLAASPDDSSSFYKDALRALGLASFRLTSPAEMTGAESFSPSQGSANSLQEKASKVLSAHCAGKGDILSSIVMLGLIGRNLDAVIQLQDVGMWEHAATMTASYLEGDQRQEALERWALHVIQAQKNLWRGLGILLSCGLYVETLEILNKEGLSLSFLTLFDYIERLYTERGREHMLGSERFRTMKKRHLIVMAKRLCNDN